MPRLRVLAGTSLDNLVPISHVVNKNQPFSISSPLFEGEIVANINGFTDANGEIVESEYFSRSDRKGITWSIQVQGRFLKERNADDILFGNIFDRPLKLPWGSSVALKFMKYIDPTMEHDLTSETKPWALSPLISTMPHLTHHRVADGEKPPLFPPVSSLQDDTSQLHLAANGEPSPTSSSSSLSSSESGSSSKSISDGQSANSKSKKVYQSKAKHVHQSFNFQSARQRRSCFSSAANRRRIAFGPEDVITTDFCYGFIEFSPGLSLQLPGGVSFDLTRYWDGQPVTFVCCERKGPDTGGDPWGRIFWCVVVELVVNDDGT